MNRIHKILETANIKLSSVVSDIVGKEEVTSAFFPFIQRKSTLSLLTVMP
jgi:hypothetical protein